MKNINKNHFNKNKHLEVDLYYLWDCLETVGYNLAVG